MNKNVLVFPCGSEIGLELHKSLNVSTHFTLIGGSSVPDHGQYVYTNYVGDIPSVDDPDFLTRLNIIIREQQIDYIFPAHDSVVLKLAQARAAGKLACEVITSSVETCEVSRSKLASYERFETILLVPTIHKADSLGDNDFPVFLKPDVGQGSKGTYKATTKQDVEFYTAKDPSLLVLEYLPGKEYTIDCFTNKDGKLLFCEGRERSRVSNGISVNSSSVADDRFRELAEKINSELTFRGVWFFQVKERASGELVLMEIAPRVAGTMGLVRGKGVNLALLSLFDAEGIEISIIENSYQLTIDRALQNSYKHDISYDHVYIDFDDLVIVNDRVNPQVMAFVYQCHNNKKQVHLLTRHANELSDTIKQYRLEGVFDELIWVKDGSDKSDYVTQAPAIFIDDSYAERAQVQAKLGIPTFDGHMIETLMEPFDNSTMEK